MPFQTTRIHFQGADIHYAVYPGGPRVLLAFHGFGQSFSYFGPVAEALSAGYTVYSIDLFYHGKSVWPDSTKTVSKGFWKDFMKAFMEQHRFREFSLAGFSLGGKFVLATLEAFPEKTRSVLFIAPDGIRTSFWYSLATYPAWTRGIFKRLVEKPDPFFKLLNFLQKTRTMDEGILRFAHYQMSSKQQREKVYNTWVTSRDLKFDMEEIAELINKNDIKIRMFLGRYDKLMTQKGMAKLLKHVKKYDLQVLDTGHSMLINKVAMQLTFL